MAFENDSNYREDAGVSRVITSAGKSLLEVELNEMQMIQNTQFRRAIKNLFGDGISDLKSISYDGTNISIASGCFLTCAGYQVNCTGLTLALAEGKTAYLQVWEEAVTYSGTLKKEGNQQSVDTVPNYIKDERAGVETTRRMVVKYTLSTTITAGRENLAIAKVVGGVLVRLIPEINLSNLYSQVLDLSDSVGETPDVLGIEVDLENNSFKRIGENEFWSSGDDYNQSPIYANRTRVNVTDAGVVVARIGDVGYTDSGALKVAVVGTDGVTYAVGTKVQSLVWQPTFYYKRVPLKVVKQTHSSYKLRGYHLIKFRDYISATPKAGFKAHPGCVVSNGAIECDGYFIGQYDGCLWDKSAGTYDRTDSVTADFTANSGDQLGSIADAKPASGKTNNFTRSNVRQLCANVGSGYQQLDLGIASAEQMLFLIEYATFNVQSTELGEGVTNVTDDSTNNLSIATPPNTLGNKSGVLSVTITINGKEYNLKVPVYRGVCNFYGNIWTFVDGFLRDNREGGGLLNLAYWKDCVYDETLDNSWKSCGFSMATSEGYVKAFGYSADCDWTYLTSMTGGDSSKPVGDYYWCNMSPNLYIALLGAHWYDGSHSGFFSWYVNYVASNRTRDIGGRLCLKSSIYKKWAC